MNDKVIHLLKTIGGTLVSAFGIWLGSTGAVDAIHAVLPSTPLFAIVGLGLGAILHGFSTALQSGAAALGADPAPAATK